MRASSLSNPGVIDLINRHFVPVYVSNEDLRDNGSASTEAKKEIQRIRHQTLMAKMSSGSVHVYLVDPDGGPVGSQHVATSSKVDQLTALLEQTVEKLKVPAGPTLVPPTRQAAAPNTLSDALLLHLVARNVTRQGDEDIPNKTKLGETRSAGWGAYPAEDWIVLSKTEWPRLLPKDPVAVGTTWELDREIAARVLTHFYPSTENNDIKKNRIDRQELRATVVSVKDGLARARLEGSLRMKHPFYHKDDDNYVDATLLGFLDFEVDQGRIRDWQLVTTQATYGRRPFGIALRTVSEEKGPE